MIIAEVFSTTKRKNKTMSHNDIQLMIKTIEDQIDLIISSIKEDQLDPHEIRARKKLARDLYFSIQYYALRNQS